jgi:hypothetical protein
MEKFLFDQVLKHEQSRTPMGKSSADSNTARNLDKGSPRYQTI